MTMHLIRWRHLARQASAHGGGATFLQALWCPVKKGGGLNLNLISLIPLDPVKSA